ncbi:MAG TPA: hypothetical protein DIC35_01910, partial [Candidatus Moranbacteria bacterium]|nr:hypothetical protein [Candidatus Moranbacteria bacterium]
AQLKEYKIIEPDRKNILKEWEKSLQFNDRFCGLYRFFEQPFQQALEEVILKKISKRELVEIISRNRADLVLNDKTRKNIEKLLHMGELKLKIHEEAETFFSDNSFAEYVSNEYGLPLNIIGAMRKNELKSAMAGKMIVTEAELRKRLGGCVIMQENNKWNLHTGEKFIYWRNKLRNMSDEVSGDVAFPGIAKGKVVIHMSWTGITEIEDGDVLVTSMTNPQMIPMLKKASAIVTDEGGITCHAAIISRELKKPCIVGTKNATQVLKNGDMVEVDAENGVVRILEKEGENVNLKN